MKSRMWFPALAFAALVAAMATSPVESVAEEIPLCNHKICKDGVIFNVCVLGTIEGTDTQCDTQWGGATCSWDYCPR